jgi:hypothetical protein
MIAPTLLLLTEHVTWVQVPKDTFDLGGVLISSLTLAGICALIAFALGTVLGATFIIRNRRHPGLGESTLTLHL